MSILLITRDVCRQVTIVCFMFIMISLANSIITLVLSIVLLLFIVLLLMLYNLVFVSATQLAMYFTISTDPLVYIDKWYAILWTAASSRTQNSAYTLSRVIMPMIAVFIVLTFFPWFILYAGIEILFFLTRLIGYI